MLAQGADEQMIATVLHTIRDLQEERVMSGKYERDVSSRINHMLDREIRATSASASSDNVYSDGIDLDNRDI